MIKPPGTSTACLFSIKLLILLGSAAIEARRVLGSKLSVIFSPDAITTVPCWATIKPLFLTSGASKAT